MTNWLTRLFGLKAPDLPTDREAQGEWIKQQAHAWHIAWHDLYDSDSAPQELDRPDPLPAYPSDDIRLAFGFSRLTPKTRRACLALFPQGDELFRRYESYRLDKPKPLNEADARAALPGLAEKIEAVGPKEKVDWTHFQVVDRNTAEGEAALGMVDPITILLERSLLEPLSPKYLPAAAASQVMNEALYVSSGNCFELRDWVEAAMFEPELDAIHTALYSLWRGGWQVFLGEAVILARMPT